MFKKIIRSVFVAAMTFATFNPIPVHAYDATTKEAVDGLDTRENQTNATQYEMGRLNISSSSYVEFTSPGKIYGTNGSSYLDPGDKCKITQVKGSGDAEQIYVTYLTKKGSVSRWFMRNKIFYTPLSDSYYKIRANGYVQAYTTYGRGTTYGKVYPNDICLALYHKGQSTLIAMPLTGTNNYRLCWIARNDYNSKFSAIAVTNGLVSESEINNAASRYGIGKNTNAYAALKLINSKYYTKLSSNKNGINIFLFEGVGNNSSSGARMNAMCVIVDKGKITFINRNCSTIPDYPFNPKKNNNRDMPTLKDGVYGFTTVNHRSQYAALNVSNAKVVRFKNKNSYYNSTAEGINVHRRSSDSIAPSSSDWVNSAGCQLIGKKSEYITFIKTLGIVDGNSVTKYKTKKSGKIVIDRTYADNYLKNVGYSTGAISMIKG